MSTTSSTTTTTNTTMTNNNNNNNSNNVTSNGVSNGEARQSQQSQQSQSEDEEDEQPLYVRYPVLSTWEFVLTNTTPDDPTILTGTIYCTDVVSQTIMIIPPISSLAELTESASSSSASTEIRIINVTCIVKATKLGDAAAAAADPKEAESALSLPVTPVLKKTLEDRERRAVRQAEESFRHINDKVTAEGQEVFDRLLKACGDVSWKGESIIVSSQIQVDPPYEADSCRILSNGGGSTAQAGLDRVRKIVSAGSRK